MLDGQMMLRKDIGFDDVRNELSRLLKMRLQAGGRDGRSPIARVLNAAMGHHVIAKRWAVSGRFREASWEFERRDMEWARARFLLQDLLRLESQCSELLRTYVKKFKKARYPDQFFALRFEVKVASMLVLRGFKFRQPDPPDFELIGHWTGIAIECGSVRVSGRKGGDLTYKILQEVGEKSRKPYASRACALAVDATNLLYRGWIVGVVAPPGVDQGLEERVRLVDDLKNRIRLQLAPGGFGSVLVYFYQYDRDLRQYEASYLRADAADITADLRRMLDHLAPIGRRLVPRPGITVEG